MNLEKFVHAGAAAQAAIDRLNPPRTIAVQLSHEDIALLAVSLSVAATVTTRDPAAGAVGTRTPMLTPRHAIVALDLVKRLEDSSKVFADIPTDTPEHDPYSIGPAEPLIDEQASRSRPVFEPAAAPAWHRWSNQIRAQAVMDWCQAHGIDTGAVMPWGLAAAIATLIPHPTPADFVGMVRAMVAAGRARP